MKNNRSAGISLEDISPRISYCHAVDAGANDEIVERRHEADRRNLVKDQEGGKEVRARFFSGHVAQALDVHEQVTNDKASTSEASKEAPGHQ